ncbi:zinc-binding protein [Botrimarina colliarenosi]|uniref:Zinc-binding protein n=1 Tax=Botrimarina colliarenosi TaxID=2528001 RepID=A0A5C6AMI6_9BACT|nr:DNA gyrase inhibitor YacG [Botrimarina colliarenosi]TWT99383.1 zinc-binding protein [Botrimarina colliarenosi]
MRCPLCEKEFDPAESKAMPFCSDRCKTIDLGRWLDEGYSMPQDADPDSDAANDWPFSLS